VGLIVYLIWGILMNKTNTGGDSVPDVTPDTSGGPSSATIAQWADAIFNFESGGDPRSVANRNNNPGNIRDSKGNFIHFATFQDGYQALIDDLNAKLHKYPDWTLTQIMARYLGQAGAAPGEPPEPKVTAEGNPFTYADSIAQKLGVSADATLRQIFGG
jgi:hypothetical protein